MSIIHKHEYNNNYRNLTLSAKNKKKKNIILMIKVLLGKRRKQLIFLCAVSRTTARHISLGSIRKVFARRFNLFEVLARRYL